RRKPPRARWLGSPRASSLRRRTGSSSPTTTTRSTISSAGCSSSGVATSSASRRASCCTTASTDGSRPLFLGLGFRLLAHDDDLLTIHLDGAPVGGRLALGLCGAALPPLAKLLLQVLEHPAPPAHPPSFPGTPALVPSVSSPSLLPLDEGL